MSAFQFATLDEIRARTPPATDWLWHGYLAGGSVTLLTSQWKTGKTTLLSVLLARMAAGGELAGRAVRAAHAAVVSEEDEGHWAARHARLALGPHVGLMCRPFRGRPTPDGWAALVGSLVELRAAGRLDLAVIDPLVAFLPGHTENDAGAILDFLHPLQRLTAAGAAVLILHHPKKGAPAAGQTARGSGALMGTADILMEMDRIGGAADGDRRRRLWGFSRHPDTPRQLVIELSEDGTDYAALGDFAAPEEAGYWPVLLGVLEDASKKLTRREVLDRWPADHPRPSDVTMWQWLEKAVAAGRLLREGAGRKNSPWVYWLAGMEAKWANDPERQFLASLAPLPELGPMSEVLGLTGLKGKGRARKGGGS
jgi:hypothetical protein